MIAHLFNEHVMQGGEYAADRPEPWTLEKLADWIKSVDPTKDEEITEIPEQASETVAVV